MNSLYFRRLLGWDTASIEAVLAEAEAEWPTSIGNATSSFVSLNGVRARDIGVAPWGPVFENLFTPLIGSVGGDPDPFFSAACIQFIAETMGIEPNGPRRSYIRHFGVSDSEAVGNIVSSAARTNYAARYNAFIAAVADAADAEQVIVSLTHNWVGNTGEYWSPEGFANTVGAISCRAALGRAASRSGTGA